MTSKYVLAVFLSAILLVSAIAIAMPTAEAKGATAKSEMKKNILRGKIGGDHLCSQGAAQMPQKQMGKPAMKEKNMNEKIAMGEKMMAPHAEWKTKSGTLTSVQDPGVGHESHQLAIILPPSGKPYTGVLSYAASENVQLVSLVGPLADGEDNGQPIWTPDGKTKFALTFVDPGNSMGTWAFSGNALAVHTKNTTPFTVSYSVTAAQ